MRAPGFQCGPVNFQMLGAHMALKVPNVSHNPAISDSIEENAANTLSCFLLVHIVISPCPPTV
jgi:hypothetical protein